MTSSDVDEYGRAALRVSAPVRYKSTVAPLSFALGAFMAIVYLRNPSAYSWLNRYLIPAAAVFFLVGAVEYLQRVYLFYPGQIRIRLLWLWRTISLPPRISIGITSREEVVVVDAATRRRVLRIPRDFTRSGKLAPVLATYYQGWQRLEGGVV